MFCWLSCWSALIELQVCRPSCPSSVPPSHPIFNLFVLQWRNGRKNRFISSFTECSIFSWTPEKQLHVTEPLKINKRSAHTLHLTHQFTLSHIITPSFLITTSAATSSIRWQKRLMSRNLDQSAFYQQLLWFASTKHVDWILHLHDNRQKSSRKQNLLS